MRLGGKRDVLAAASLHSYITNGSNTNSDSSNICKKQKTELSAACSGDQIIDPDNLPHKEHNILLLSTKEVTEPR